MTEGRKCPCSFEINADGKEIDIENLALDDELSEQVEILKVTLSVHEATMDANALLRPFTEMRIYEDILSHAQIISSWNQYRASKKPH
jgi:hypothetical protein